MNLETIIQAIGLVVFLGMGAVLIAGAIGGFMFWVRWDNIRYWTKQMEYHIAQHNKGVWALQSELDDLKRDIRKE